MQTAIEANADLDELTRIQGVRSLGRGLKMEDAEAARFGAVYGDTEGSDGTSTPPAMEDEPMEIIATGGATVNVNSPPPLKPDPPTIEVIREDQTKVGSPAPSLAKMALVAALAGTGLGIAAPVTAWMLGAFDKPEPPAVTIPVDNNDTRGIQFRKD